MGLGFKVGAQNTPRKWVIVSGRSIVKAGYATGSTGGGWQGRYTEEHDEEQWGHFSADLTLSTSCIGMIATVKISGGYSGRTPYDGCYCNIVVGGVTYSGSSIDRTVTFKVASNTRTIHMEGTYSGESRMWVPIVHGYVDSLVCEDI